MNATQVAGNHASPYRQILPQSARPELQKKRSCPEPRTYDRKAEGKPKVHNGMLQMVC